LVSTVISFTTFGVDALEIFVEVGAGRGLPGVAIVGKYVLGGEVEDVENAGGNF